MNVFTKIIAQRLQLPEQGVENTLKLLDESCTIPFISRYRKERTGNMNEVQITQISELNDKLKELQKPQGDCHEDYCRTGENDTRTAKAH